MPAAICAAEGPLVPRCPPGDFGTHALVRAILVPQAPGSPAKSGAAFGELDPDDEHIDASKFKLPTNVPKLTKVDVKTGEEDWETLLDDRCKVFRFREGEWKERCLGQGRILRQADDGRGVQARFIARQEKTEKVKAHFAITTQHGLCVRWSIEFCFLVYIFARKWLHATG